MPTPSNRAHLLFLLALPVLILALYYNTLDNLPTNWDDPALFSRTTLQALTPENLREVLTPRAGSTFQPVRDLSYMLDFALFGENPVPGMHLHSIWLYTFMIIACWLFLRELFDLLSEDDRVPVIWASLTTLIYAVHPVHVESVTWLYARKEPLLGLFTFVCLYAFLRARSGARVHGALCLVALILAILSKPTALVLPVVLIVLDLLIHRQKPTRAFWKRRLLVYLPLLILVIPLIWRLLSTMSDAGGIKPWHGGSVGTNLLAVSQIFVSYIALIGFHINYAADYPIELSTDPKSWQAWAFLGTNLLIVTGAMIAVVRRKALIAFFVVWFYLFLLPVAHVLPIAQIMADRYALLPSLSWCVLLGYVLTLLWQWRLTLPGLSPRFPMLIAAALIACLTGGYAAMTVRQNDIWQNSLTLWEDTLAKYPRSSPANVNLSVLYIRQGRYQEAADLCMRAIEYLPYDYLAISNLALAQMMMHQYDHAIHNYLQALRLKPGLTKAQLGLANAYWEKGDYEGAISVYAQLKDSLGNTRPYGPHIALRLGLGLWKTGQPAQGKGYLDEALKLSRGNPTLLSQLAAAFTSMGDSQTASRISSGLPRRIPAPGDRTTPPQTRAP